MPPRNRSFLSSVLNLLLVAILNEELANDRVNFRGSAMYCVNEKKRTVSVLLRCMFMSKDVCNNYYEQLERLPRLGGLNKLIMYMYFLFTPNQNDDIVLLWKPTKGMIRKLIYLSPTVI